MNALRLGVLTAVLSALLAACGGVAPTRTPIASTQAEIWVHPKPYVAGVTGLAGGGSTDLLSLFAGTSEWPTVEANAHVFGAYAGWLAGIDSATFAQVIGFLNAQHMALEIEAPSLQATATCGNGVEGFVPFGQSLTQFTNSYLYRLQAAGADVRYIKVDEPYFFGSLDPYDPQACHWPASQVAQGVAQYTALVHMTYPNASVGDVEPIVTNAAAYSPDVVTALSNWHDAYKAYGAQFPFFVADMDFSNPVWPALAVQMQTTMRARGEQFGIIFSGDPTDTSDAMWSAKTVARSQAFTGAAGSAPDFVLFQSWNPYPQHCLPETDPTTFMGAVKAYIDARPARGASVSPFSEERPGTGTVAT
jgi:hypothetical protein